MTTDEKLRIIARAILNFAEFTRQVYENDIGETKIGNNITDYADASLVDALKEIAK